MIRVYLIDDHDMVRTGFKLVLSDATDIVVAGEASNAEAALPEVQKLKPDVVLCDLHLPGLSGLDVTERIVRGGWGPKVIVVSAQEDGPLPQRLLEAGASGYLAKAAGAEELLKAIREVARGRRYLSSSVAQALAFAKIEPEASPFDRLSRRELQIAMLMVQGLRVSEIANRLNLSPKTVSTHKYNLMEKLGVADIPALTRLAIKHGLSVDGV
jgi:two-component system invasion response regulator UvrY